MLELVGSDRQDKLNRLKLHLLEVIVVEAQLV